jgi:hypothetical protein
MAVVFVAVGLVGLSPMTARADDNEAPKPAPRTAIEIGGASVVLVAANGHLYAFVDRIEDNAPVAASELSVADADGTAIDMRPADTGLFAAPFDRTGHMRDAFMVSLRSSVASGEAQAEIAYDDVPDAPSVPATPYATKLTIALVSGGIGAVGAVLFMLRVQGGRKRAAARSVGTAKVA